jgi:hypothetical protein
LLVSAQQQRAVRHVAQFWRRDTEGTCQLFPIVEAAIREQRQPRVPLVHGLCFEPVFLIHPHQAMAEPNRAINDVLTPVWPAIGKCIRHAFQNARMRRCAVELQDAENRAHTKHAISVNSPITG